MVLLGLPPSPPVLPGYKAQRLPYAIPPEFSDYSGLGTLTEDGKYWFFPGAKRTVERHDQDGIVGLRGEQITTALDQSTRQPRIYSSTTSQQFRGYNGAQGPAAHIFNGPSSGWPIASRDRQHVLAGTTWYSYNLKLRFSGVSEIRWLQRGPNPNFDATFSPDGHHRFDVLASLPGSNGWNLLVAFRKAATSRTVELRGYRFVDGSLTQLTSTAVFGRLPRGFNLPLRAEPILEPSFAYDPGRQRLLIQQWPHGRVELEVKPGPTPKWVRTKDMPPEPFFYFGGYRYRSVGPKLRGGKDKLLAFDGKWIDTGAARFVAMSGSQKLAVVEGLDGDMWMMKRVAGPVKTR